MNNIQSFFHRDPHYSAETAGETSDDALSGEGRRFMRKLSWDQIARLLFYCMMAVMPLWVLPLTVFPVELNKAFLFSLLTLFAFIAWLLGRIQEGEFLLPKHFLALALVLLAVVSLLSALFSVSGHVSFIGFGYETGTVASFVLFVLAALLVSFLFQKKSHVQLLLIIFAVSSLALFVFQLLHIFIDFSPWSGVFNTPSGNPIGTWNAFGLYASFVGFLFLFLAKNSAEKRIRYLFYAVTVAAVLMMVAVNFPTAWILFVVFNVVLFAYLYSFRRIHAGLHWEPLLALLIALFFLVTPILGQGVSSLFKGDIIEIRPSWQATGEVIRSTLMDGHLWFGSGPNTFLYDWLQYKPSSINATEFWATRFSSGVGFFPTLLATLGVAGGVVLLFLIGALFFYGLRTVLRYALFGNENTYAIAFFLGVLFLFFTLLFYTPGFSLTLFFFLFLGLFMAQASAEGALSYFRVPLFQNAGIGFVAALLLLFLSVGGIAGIYLLGQKYVAAIIYGKGVALFNSRGGTIEEVRNQFARAFNLDERDRYARSLADADLFRMNALLNQSDITPDELRNSFQTFLGQAIQSSQRAIELNGVDPLNWLILGRTYEAVIPFQIEGAAGFADNMYERAYAQDPRSPEALFLRARIQTQMGNFDDAKSVLQQAINIKTDYAPARFLLAQIEAQQGDINGAIEETRNAQFLLPNDTGVLFQLGLLYYQNNQFENARLVFERAIELNENYSNARYFLGLIYDRQGDVNTALMHFERILELNPDNDEVEKILLNLKGGKPALAGITPPPEERRSPPLEEEN